MDPDGLIRANIWIWLHRGFMKGGGASGHMVTDVEEKRSRRINSRVSTQRKGKSEHIYSVWGHVGLDLWIDLWMTESIASSWSACQRFPQRAPEVFGRCGGTLTFDLWLLRFNQFILNSRRLKIFHQVMTKGQKIQDQTKDWRLKTPQTFTHWEAVVFMIIIIIWQTLKEYYIPFFGNLVVF